MSAVLYVVGTPIGNLGDLSPRAIDAFENCDFIAAEDTRVTLKLLNSFGIKKPMISYHEHNRFEMSPRIVARLMNGESCVLVTDGYARDIRPRRGFGAHVPRARDKSRIRARTDCVRNGDGNIRHALRKIHF